MEEVNTAGVATDCRSEEGITVGLFDAIISISRILRRREFSGEAVEQALLDIADDEDVRFVMLAAVKIKAELRRNVVA